MIKKISYSFVLITLFITNLNAQQIVSQSQASLQVKELLNKKTIDVKIKEYFVREIRKTELVKPIDNHEFVHFYVNRYDSKYKTLIKNELSKHETITNKEGKTLANEIIAAMANDFNNYKEKHPNNNELKNKDVSHFEIYDLANRETNKGAGQPCNNADFETGDATGWDLSYGQVSTAPTAPFDYINVNPTTLATSPGQHTIMTGAGTDAIGGFPVVFPGGTSSLMIGDGTGTNNSAADASQTFLVDANSAAFSYSYAIVLMDPGHTAAEQPYFKINMYDSLGNTIQCGDYSVVAGGSGADPDFIPFTFNSETGVYMPWRTTFAPLQGYINQNVTIEFVVGDCAQGGHFGYAYIDASCASMEILGPDTITCTGPIVISGPPGAASYLWSPNGETTESITVSTPGQYLVDVVPVTGAACGITLTKDIYAFVDTVSSIFTANPDTICAGESITFADQSVVTGTGTIVGWEWDFNNDGTVDNTTQNPSHIFTTAGTYNVNLNVSTQGCSDDTTMQIVVVSGSTANFTASTVCLGVATDFTDVSIGGVDTWNWDFDNNGTIDNTSQNPSHTFPSTGTFPVNLAVSVGGNCTHDTTINITVTQSATANFTAPTVCLGVATDFTDVSIGGVDTWGWDFDNDGTVDNTTQNPSTTFSSIGTFPVNLAVSVGGNCAHDTTINITVTQSSTADFTASTVCLGVATDFTDNSIGGVDTWGWDFDNNGTIDNSTQNPSHTFPSTGTFPVNLSVSVGGNCTHDTTINITVTQSAIANFTAPTVCLGVATDFTDVSTGGVDTWGWDFDNNGTIDNTTQNPSHTFSSVGSYAVNLAVSVGGNCAHDTTIIITVSQSAKANFTAPTVCNGGTNIFTDISTGGVDTWGWDFDNNGTIDNTTQNPTHTFPSAGTFPVNLSVSVGGNCAHDTTINIIVNSQPIATFNFTNVCFGATTNFTDASNGNGGVINQWSWDFDNDGIIDNTTANPTNNYTTSGVYPVSLIVSNSNNCSDTLSLNVSVNPNPVADFSTDANPCEAELTNFTDLSSNGSIAIGSWSWDFNNDGIIDNTTQNPSVNLDVDAIHLVTLNITDVNGCSNSVIKTVLVELTDVIKNIVPNVFTPNGDNWNDELVFKNVDDTKDFSIKIFNRWGRLMFESSDPTKSWNGKDESEGTYFYELRYTDNCSQEEKLVTGTVTLLRGPKK